MKKKKILIVNNNMKIGGVQKALLSLLNEIENTYDITLFLFSKNGELFEKIPKNVNVVICNSFYKYFAMGKEESKNSLIDFILRNTLAFLTKIFGRGFSIFIANLTQKKLNTEYDYAISYLHSGALKSFYGGCNEFVLNKVKAGKKVAFIHGDYLKCGANNKKTNKIYSKFDLIAACSGGCRESFLKANPQLEYKVKTVINCHNFSEIIRLSKENTVIYDSRYVNVIIIARLNYEKGIERAIYALKYVLDKNLNVKLHIVGNGVLRERLVELSKELCIEDNVIFYGEQVNPYRFLPNADLLLITSYHEAAPLVIDEARCLGIPVMSTLTTSAIDMIENRNIGWVCENNQNAINECFLKIVCEKDLLNDKKIDLKSTSVNNCVAVNAFDELVK